MDELWHNFVGSLVRDWWRVPPPWDGVLVFFIYDSVKILALLAGIIFLVSFLRTFLAPERVRLTLGKMPRPLAHLAAGGLGMLTPFCSCSAVPLFLGFVQAGVPLGITMTFLVASPMINEVALVMLLGLFGPTVAGIYLLGGLLVALTAGFVFDRMNPEKLLAPQVLEALKKGIPAQAAAKPTWGQRWSFAGTYTKDLLKKIWPWVLGGIGLGALIHGWVPQDFLVSFAGKDQWWALPLVILLGIPLYSGAAAMAPLVGALVAKGMALGTALAFMMSVTALSLPEFILLKQVMRWRLLGVFALVVFLGILVIGTLMNLVPMFSLPGPGN